MRIFYQKASQKGSINALNVNKELAKSLGNNPMVGATVAIAVAVEQSAAK